MCEYFWSEIATTILNMCFKCYFDCSQILTSFWNWEDQHGRKLALHCKSYYHVGYVIKSSFFTCVYKFSVCYLWYENSAQGQLVWLICLMFTKLLLKFASVMLFLVVADEPVLQNNASLRQKALLPMVRDLNDAHFIPFCCSKAYSNAYCSRMR